MREPEPNSGNSYGSRRRAAAFRTVLLYVTTLFAIATVVFLMPRAMPGDPLRSLEDPDAGIFIRDAELRGRVLAHYDLDGPLHEQYVGYLGDLATAEFGWSIARNAPVSELVASHLPWTLLLVGLALGISSLLSYGAGLMAAWRRGTLGDRSLIVLLTGLRSVPEYAIAVLMLVGFAVLLPLFPLAGARTPFAVHPTTWHRLADLAHHLALPLAALTISMIGGKFLLLRNTAISVLGEDYMLLARAKGLSSGLQAYRHVGRNAVLPFLTVVGVQAGFAVGGSIFVEAVFAYPGMGTLILQAVEARDYPVLEAAFLVLAATVLLANLLIELVYVRLDPRAAIK